MYGFVLVAGLFLSSSLGSLAAPVDNDPEAPMLPIAPIPIGPAPKLPDQPAGVDWNGLFRDSSRFLAIQHTFRVLTEPGTREGVRNFSPARYLQSVRSLHGWSDSDPFLVNYIGHPLQGSASGFIWVQNDRRFRSVEFGNNRHYWKSRLRATAFSFVYSEQFEIGPLSEASIGLVQRSRPAQGLVDHVITPTAGLGVMVVEDALDKYVIKRIERWPRSPYIRMLIRGTLNPSRSMANMMRGKVPWYRDTRDGIFPEHIVLYDTASLVPKAEPVPDQPVLAPLELNAQSHTLFFPGSGPCVGGGASAAYRLTSTVQIVMDVSGCTLMGFEDHMSGNSLTYMIGPRWTPPTDSRFSTHAELLFGGHKVTTEQLFPDRKAAVLASRPNEKPAAEWRPLYTEQKTTNGAALAVGGGLNYRLTPMLAFRVADFQYLRSWLPPLDGVDRNDGFRLTTGFVLRMGTW